MSQFTNALKLPFLITGQSGHVPYNNGIRVLDAIIGSAAVARQNNAPASPADGDMYIIDTPSTGNTWDGHADELALFFDNAWVYVEPIHGLRVWAKDENVLYVYTSTWQPSGGGIPLMIMRNSGSATTTSPTASALNFLTEDLEHQNNYVHPLTGDLARTQVVTGGFYQVTFTAEIESASNSSVVELGVGQNSETSFVTASTRQITLTSGQFALASFDFALSLSADDWLAILWRRVSGTGTPTIGSTKSQLIIRKLNP